MRARKFEMKPTPYAPSKNHPNTTFKKWVGDRTDLGLVKGETYTWTEFGAAVGIVASSMRGRVRGAKEVSDLLGETNHRLNSLNIQRTLKLLKCVVFGSKLIIPECRVEVFVNDLKYPIILS